MPWTYLRTVFPIYIIIYVILQLGSLALASESQLISRTVGQVLNQVMTSRDVLASYYVDEFLFKKDNASIKELSLKDPLFDKQLSALLFEWTIYLESQGFDLSVVPRVKVLDALKMVQLKGQKQASWRKLQMSRGEIEELLIRKLQAKKFIHFRSESLKLPVAENEARDYFDSHVDKFRNMAYEDIKEKIKAFLQENSSRRTEKLKEWFEILRIKYKVKKHM